MPAVKRKTMQRSLPFKSYKRRKSSEVKTTQATTLGRITGNIQPSSTTLARAPGPFSSKKFLTFLYENALTQVAGAANVLNATFKPNDMYDFDNSGDSGNKQPLYYDTLLSASGPYKQYKVHSWRTTYYFVNNSTNTPVDIFISPPLASTSEFDSLAEADNMPGVTRLRLTNSSGGKNYGEISVTGHIKDVYPTLSNDSVMVGTYNASPSTICYQCVLIRGSDGTNAPVIYMSVKHEAFTELSFVDALVS